MAASSTASSPLISHNIYSLPAAAHLSERSESLHDRCFIRSTRAVSDQCLPFILGAVLGRGSTGVVYAATYRLTGEQVAVKVIEIAYLDAENRRWQKVRDEIEILKIIKHPNVLTLFDVIETNDRLYLIMEYVRGGELFDHIDKNGRLGRNEALRLLSQIISAVSYCHRLCICHRDLKPENILLDQEQNVKIADFGMAKKMPDSGILSTSCGSPHYAPPEVVEGRQYDGRARDVWSIGVILYALVTAHLPFDDLNVPNLLQKIVTGSFSVPTYVPTDIAHLIRLMLTVDPKQRVMLEDILDDPCYLLITR